MQEVEVNHILDIFGNTSDFGNYLTITLAALVGGFLFTFGISYQDMIFSVQKLRSTLIGGLCTFFVHIKI